VFFIHPNNTIVIHIVKESGSVIVKWEVNEKIFGNKAMKFITKIVVNIVIIKFSVLFSALFIVNFTSFFILLTIKLLKAKVGFFIFHIFIVINNVTNMVVIHDIDIKVELGSKIENRFIIILIVFFLRLFLYFYLSFFFVVLCLIYLLLLLIITK